MKNKLSILLAIAILLFLDTACGVTATSTPPMAIPAVTMINTASSSTHTAIATPTQITKKADMTAIAQERSTEMAYPTATWGKESTPTFFPSEPTPLSGFLPDFCQSFPGHKMIPARCWRGTINGMRYGIYSGAGFDDKTLTMLAVSTAISSTQYYNNSTHDGAAHIAYIEGPHVTIITDKNTVFVFNVQTRQWEQPGPCQIYPLALSKSSIPTSNKTDLNNVRMSWLSWSGKPDSLTVSLNLPGNVNTYVNPNNQNDHSLVAGKWVYGRPDVDNSDKVRDALTNLEQYFIIVPVFDQTQGNGDKAQYHIVSFAWITINNYSFDDAQTISVTYMGPATCSN